MPPKKPRAPSAPRPRRAPPDPRTPRRILEEEALLTKPMLAKVLGYGYRALDAIIAEDCVSGAPCLRPVYLRRPPPRPGDPRRPSNHPSFKSARFRREDVLAYVEKMREEFPLDLEWKHGGTRE